MKKIAGNYYSANSINVKQLVLLIYCLYTRGKSIVFCQLCRFVLFLILHLCFDSELFITFLVGRFLGAIGRKRIFLFGRFIACINTYLDAKFLKNLSGGSV